MKPEFVPFEKIDKNKWNGTVHYAQNSNIYGYYWYLKSVVKEWDALIEGDYQSVMPIPRFQWSDEVLNLIPSSGPYIANAISENRISAFFSAWKETAGQFSYPFNEKTTAHLVTISDLRLTSTSSSYIHLSRSYDALVKNYTPATTNDLNNMNAENFSFASLEKPEVFLANEKLSHQEMNILHRLFYNALHRGIGTCFKVQNNIKNKSAFAFIIHDTGKMYIVYTGRRNDKEAELVLFDTLIKNNAGKMAFLQSTPVSHKILTKFGAVPSQLLHFERPQFSLSQKIKKIISKSVFSAN